MSRCMLFAGLAFTAVCAAWGQPKAPLSFEVASVKIAAPCCPPGQWPRNRAGVDRINFRNASLWFCITYAYGMKSYQVTGPDWLRDVRLDIVAKGHEGTRAEQLSEMMQTLLAERFKLRVRREAKEISGLALVVGSDGAKLKESAAQSGDGQGGASIGMSASLEGTERLDFKSALMTNLSGTLTGLLSRPVADKTGLTGRYDFIVEFSRTETAGPRVSGGYGEPPPFPPPPPGGQPGLSIYSSIRQLGLRLEQRKIPLETIVIEHAERVPSEN